MLTHSLLGASLYDIFGASWSTKGGIFKLIYEQERSCLER